jgi:hypothetical protein
MACGRGYECSPVGGGCGEHFRSLDGFDAHLEGEERACLGPERIEALGYNRDDQGLWTRGTGQGQRRRTSFRPQGAISEPSKRASEGSEP